jgi:hypothetical protein
MDIYLAIGFAPLVLGVFAIRQLRAVRYLVEIVPEGLNERSQAIHCLDWRKQGPVPEGTV